MSDKPATRALDFIASEPWAITTEALELIDGIAQRTAGETPEMVAARIGRPLQNTRRVEMRDGVAVIPITGPIFRRANLFTEISGATSIETLALDFRAALDDQAVESIVLNVDSPGGMAGGIAEFADMVHAADKPVVSYIGDIGASAAYWIAAAADEIVVGKLAVVGSIGAILGVDVSEDKKKRTFVSSQSPDKRPNPDTEAGRNTLQAHIDTMAQVFIDTVAEFRGVDVETVINDFGRGGVKVGGAAVEAGLADRLGSLETVIAGLSGQTERSIQMSASNNGPEITRELIASDHPAIAESFRNEGRDAGLEAGAATATPIAILAGAEDERARIRGVHDQFKGLPGNDVLAEALMFDGKTTGPEAAVQILAADKQVRGAQLADTRDDAPEPVPATAAPEPKPKIDPSLPAEERAKLAWEQDEGPRAEFATLADYIAFEKAADADRVKILGAA